MKSDDGASCHPTGITLRRPDYFTLPSLNELVEMMDANGECVVENFVVGRDGYGNVVFPGFTNVAGLNLDEIGKAFEAAFLLLYLLITDFH